MSSLCPLCRLDLAQGRGGEEEGREGEREDTDEEFREQQVISHLRAMLPGRRDRSASNSDGSNSRNNLDAQGSSGSGMTSDGTSPDAGEESNSRFFRYIASKRRAIAGRRRIGSHSTSQNTTTPIRGRVMEENEEGLE